MMLVDIMGELEIKIVVLIVFLVLGMFKVGYFIKGIVELNWII